MNEHSIAESGDEFKEQVRTRFAFLTTEFGFEPALDESSAYSHRLTFRNLHSNQLVEVVNAFHGVDYGFEVNIHLASHSRLLDQRNMVYYQLKEDQDVEFAYLAEAVEKLRSVLQDEA
ncbi:hypothetical protein F6455_12450 [Proteobacteria bacterium 005FR1]|nr:hypothetical protein [Proteobacteria bacterium 005FR1]